MEMRLPVNPTGDLYPPRFFLDSSVILAGTVSLAGASHAILAMGELGFIQLITSEYVLGEVEKNLAQKLMRGVSRYEQVRQSIHWEIVSTPSLEQIQRWIPVIPLKDAPVLAAAVLSSPARLVTLDTKHFLNSPDVTTATNLTIVTPGSLVRELRIALITAFAT